MLMSVTVVLLVLVGMAPVGPYAEDGARREVLSQEIGRNATDVDGLELSWDLQDEQAIEGLSFASAAVDADRPGFGSLLPAMRAARDEGIDAEILVRYHDGLSRQLAESRARLEGLEVPEALQEALAPVFQTTRGVLDRMESVLDFLGTYLEQGGRNDLEQAIQVLEGIHGEMEEVLRQAE